MTLQEKKQKVKLIVLITICDFLHYKKDPPKTFDETLLRGMNSYYWINQLRIIQSQPIPKLEKGGVAICGDCKNPEIIG